MSCLVPRPLSVCYKAGSGLWKNDAIIFYGCLTNYTQLIQSIYYLCPKTFMKLAMLKLPLLIFSPSSDSITFCMEHAGIGPLDLPTKQRFITHFDVFWVSNGNKILIYQKDCENWTVRYFLCPVHY